MPSTPVFGWPYQSRLDPPHGPHLGEDLALAIEATVTPAVGPRMGCSLRRVAAQTLPDAAFTSILWDTEDADTDGLYSSGDTITVPAGGGGLWAVSATVFAVAPPTVLGFVTFFLNGGAQGRFPFADNVASTAVTLPLDAGGTIVVQAYRDAAAGTTMTASFYAYRVGL